jgi:uroporphyrinogen-III synthase
LNVALSLLREEKIDAVTFTSPAAVRQFYRCFLVPDLPGLVRPPLLCAIGATTAAALEELGMRADVMPAQADAESMIATLAESLGAQKVSPSTEQ